MAAVVRPLCYTCNKPFNVRQLAHMDGDENVIKRQIAITRRDEFGHPPLHLDDNSRLCINCNLSIIDELAMIEADPTCLGLNVLTQTASQTCVICNAQNNVRTLSIQCRVQVFMETNIYIPDNVSCENYLDKNGFFRKYYYLHYVSSTDLMLSRVHSCKFFYSN